MQTEKIKKRSEVRVLPSVPDVNYRPMGAAQSAELVNPLKTTAAVVVTVVHSVTQSVYLWIVGMTNTRARRSRQGV